MTTEEGTPAAGARRAGRPSRIDRGAIARTAADLPLEEITMRSVAGRLGVSVAALYHHVGGREELLRLAADQAALRMTLPRDEGQHWATWCYQWADYIRRAFVADPELLKQYIDGAFGAEVMAAHLDAAIGLCVRQGHTEAEAFALYELISECALGAAISEIRAVRNARAGRPFGLQLRAVLARRGPGSLPSLRRLLDRDEPTLPSFADRVTAVLAGVAVARGDDPEDLARHVRAGIEYY